MAFVNLLNGSYSGAMGQTVGVKHNKKPVVRSRVFSKAPMTEAQKTALNNYTAYNQMISPRIRVLLDSSAVKDKSVTAWAYYRKLFKYAIGKTPQYPNCYPLAPPAEPWIITSTNPRITGGQTYASSMSFVPQWITRYPNPDFNLWVLVLILPQGSIAPEDNQFITCQKLDNNFRINLEQSQRVEQDAASSGILFKPQGKYIRIVDAWDYADSSGRS